MIPDDLRYTEEHEWVRLDGEEAVIGITDYAQKELGDITFVELPEPGRKLKEKDTLATIESVKAASYIFTPLSGTVLEINEDLGDTPESINSSPYEKGWICKIRVKSMDQYENLLSAQEYESYLEDLED